MLEINRVLGLDRLSQKMSSDDSGKPAKTKKKNIVATTNGFGNGTGPRTTAGSAKREYSTAINFEFVPSGKIHMNREARNRIIDFFQ